MRNTRRRSGQSGEQENGHDIATPEPNGLPSAESPQLPAAAAAATPNDASKKPTKKRKLDESPPWKSATTQTPTSFIGDDGRRKSGRTNALPKDLMPPPSNGTPSNGTPTRSTRISHRDVSTSASLTRTPASSKQSRSKKHQSPSRAGSSRRGVKATPPSASSSGSTRSPPSKRFAPNSRSRNQTKTPTRTSSKSTVSPAIGTRKSARALQKAVAAAEEELAQGEALRKLYGNESSELSSYVTDEEEDEETGEDASMSGRVPKLRLKFGMPRAVITHPSQVPLPKPFASFEEFLAQDSIGRNPELLAQAEEEARDEAELRNRIDYEARHGLLTAENCSLFVPEKQPEPPQQYSHHDHLIAHALNFHKLLVKERKEHQELMRKRNVALMAEIKRRRPRTREEIELEQYTENRKAFKEQISQLRRKWEEVMKEVEKRRITRAEEDRRQAGKEHLNRMLEHSTVLLDARRGDRQGSLLESGAEDESGSAESDNEEGSDEEKLDEANMSDSESDQDVDGEDEDANLTVEELRAKYSGITAPTPAKTDEDMDLDAGSDQGSDVDMVDERHNDVMALANGEDVPELDEVDDVLLDDSDRSTDMDSDADSEGEYDDEEDDDDDEEESGLLGFYGGMPSMTDGLTAKTRELEEDFDDEEEDDDDDIDLVGVPKPPPRIVEVEKHEPSPRAISETIKRPATPENAEQVDVRETQAVVSTTPVRSPNRIDISICKSTEKPCMDVVAEAPQEPEERQGTEEPYQPMMNIEPVEEARPRIVELEDDGETPRPSGDAPPIVGKAESVDMETGTSTSLVDAKDSGAHSSPTTSPEATPQPADADAEPKTPIPFLLRGTLRKYQHHGLDWLSGLYDNHTNGILADEMGLGKTIQTIALIAHLACEKGIWGPHLIVVPTSVMLNWEMEFKKWAPGFKILTYYGSREQRAEKRKGWLGTNNWHVCITSYQIVLADQVTFKRRNWHYLILDEAHNIKNFRSQRWQTLLNFKSQARLLLTGTPLQNNLVELWSLLYFLMPSGSSSLPTGFANLQEFQEWFAHPVDQMIEGGREGMDDEAKRTVTKLHKVLRPYLLRRLKADVEKQMPAKYEHVVYCRLSKRQRYLYDDFMSMAKTRETLASGNYLSIINCLMQLRKVCNHPDLFETRQIVTSFAMQKSAITSYDTKELLIRRKLMARDPFTLETGDTSFLEFVGLVPGQNSHLTTRHTDRIQVLSATELLRQYHAERAAAIEPVEPDYTTIEGNIRYMQYKSEISAVDNLKNCVRLNRIRTRYRPLYSSDLVEACSRDISVGPIKPMPRDRKQITSWFLSHSTRINSMIPTLTQRAESMETTIIKFGCITPAIVATDMAQIALTPSGVSLVHSLQSQYPTDPFHEPRIRLSIAFPDKRLLQYDCGKLQRLDTLLRTLQAGGHRALIFTQMTKVLDLLEQFLNIHGHRYLRLDGATKVEMRQQLTDRFNNDTRIPVFILSTRSGGLGINLTGADTVIFYDLDWNPAMDKQCQDRCHRIGQTRDVHIYRFVSEYTIESNILRKSEQKRMLDDIIIQEGDFTTDYFNKLSIRDMLGDDLVADLEVEQDAPILQGKNIEKTLEAVEDIEDTTAAKVAQREVLDTDVADFAEEKAKEEAKKEEAAKVAATPTSAPTTTAATPAETPAPVEEVQAEEEEEVEPGHVDDFMIRFVEWELKDVPVVIPDKSRRKRSKKGKKF